MDYEIVKKQTTSIVNVQLEMVRGCNEIITFTDFKRGTSAKAAVPDLFKKLNPLTKI